MRRPRCLQDGEDSEFLLLWVVVVGRGVEEPGFEVVMLMDILGSQAEVAGMESHMVGFDMAGAQGVMERVRVGDGGRVVHG